MISFDGKGFGESRGPDWPYLRGALAAFAGAVALSASLLAGSAYFERRMEREYRHNNERLDVISRRYRAVDEEEKVIKDYLPRFTDLHKTGLLGRERRLSWIEALQDAGDRLGLPSLGYEIRAQRPYPPGFAAPPGRYRVFASEMTLNMQLLHEGDLFALLALLDERAQGLYTVSACELTRNFTALTDNPAAGNVGANCVLEWFSIVPAEVPELNA